MFVSAGNGGIFRSGDWGGKWELCISGLPDNGSVQALVSYNDTIYTSVYQESLFRSIDKGKSWESINSGIENETFYTIYVGSNGIYAQTADREVYYSSDWGLTWELKNTGIGTNDIGGFLTTTSNTFAAGTSLYKLTGDGSGWETVDMGYEISGILRCITEYNNVIYTCDDGHVYISKNDGSSWTKSTLDVWSSIITVDHSADSVFITTSDGRIFYTNDEGGSWTLIQNTNAQSFVHDALFTNDKIIMSTGKGIFDSSDGGENWQVANNGVAAEIISNVTKLGSSIFATGKTSVYKTFNKGDTWEFINRGEDFGEIYDIAVVKTSLFIGTANGLYLSKNYGGSWSKNYDPGVNKSVQAIDFNNGLMAMAINADGVYISTDTAETWTLTNTSGLKTETSYWDILVVGDTLAVSTHGAEIFVSKDRGSSWSEITITGNYYNTFDLEFYDGCLYAGTAHGVLRSDDLGKSWEIFGSLIPSVQDLVFVNDKIYAATSVGCFVNSVTRSEWIECNDGLGSIQLNSIFVDYEKVFAGTWASSVWSCEKKEFNLSPIITGTVNPSRTVLEDDTLVLSINDLVVDDPDNNFPEDFYHKYWGGDNYTIKNDTVFPDKDFDGSLEIRVRVSDGIADSDPYYLTLDVKPVNDAPVITSTEVFNIKEGCTQAIALADLVVTDPDNSYPEDFALIVSDGDNYSVSSNVVTPNDGFIGELTVPVKVNDGELDSETANLSITVAANVIPVIADVDTVVTEVNKSVEINLSDISVEDSDNTFPDDYTLSVNDGNNYSVSGNTVTPNNDYVGYLTVPISVNDGLDESNMYNVIIDVQSVAGIYSLNEFAFDVYPNPASGFVEVSMSNEINTDLTVQVIKLDGTIISENRYAKQADSFKERIQLDNLESGLYLLRIVTEDGKQSVQRIAIK